MLKWKTKLFIAIIIMIAIICLKGKVFANEDDSDLSYRTISCEYSKKQTGFTYSDEIFLRNSEELSTDMAKISVALAACAYEEYNIENVLEEMGFKEKTMYNYGRSATLEDNDYVAFCIASKVIKYNGQDYKIYVAPIRGTPNTAEWFSDFKLSENNDINKKNGNHYGFYTAANEVRNEISYKVSNDEFDEDHTIVLVTGHSRGAAVSNIVAGQLSGSKYSQYVKKEHIFGYTYACPSVSKYADNTLMNIYNFNNPGDAIPILPLQGEGWNYKRFGQTVELDTADFNNVSRRFEEICGKEFLSMDNSKFYKDIITHLVVNEKDFYSADNKIILTCVAYLLGGKNSVSLPEMLNYYFWEEGGDTLIELLDFLTDNTFLTTIAGIKNSLNNEVQEYNLLLQYVIIETDSCNEEEFTEWINQNYNIIDRIENRFKVNINSKSDFKRATEISNKQQAMGVQIDNILTDIEQFSDENDLSKIIDIIGHRSCTTNICYLDKFNVLWV